MLYGTTRRQCGNKAFFLLSGLFLGAFAGLVLTALLCILFAALVNGELIPFKFLRGLAAAAVFFGALWSAIVGAGKGAKLPGALIGVLIFGIMLWLFGALIYGGAFAKGAILQTPLLLLVASGIGTFLAGSRR